MPTTTSVPRIEVTLHKTIERKSGLAARYTGSARKWDLTRWLGDRGAVMTSKSMGTPEGGFALTFPDRADYQLADTLYAAIEPMDIIEIRMGREAGETPVVMRGFVTRVGRSERMGNDGQPQRLVVINGHDYGVVLRWCVLNWNREYLGGTNPYLTLFKLQDKANMSVESLPAGEFIAEMIEKIANVWLEQLDSYSESSAAQKLKIDSVVKDGRITPYYVGSHQGDMWALITSCADIGWNEFFIEDRSDAPYAVYRPAPYKDAYTGKLILPFATEPHYVEVTDEDVVSFDLAHSSDRTVNWLWVDFPTSNLSPGINAMDAIYRGLPQILDENSNPKLFGDREMHVVTTQVSNDNVSLPAEKNYEERTRWTNGVRQWFDERRDQMIAINKDNCVFEEGRIVVKGNDGLRIGKVLKLTRGSFKSEYYITGVVHHFQPFTGWMTTLQVERGTGFLERMKSARSPMWAEGRPGAVP